MITVVPPKDRETVVSDATSSNFTDVTDQTHESGVMESSLPGGMAGNDGVVIPYVIVVYIFCCFFVIFCKVFVCFEIIARYSCVIYVSEINTLILNVPAVVIESTRRGSGFSEGLTLDPPSSTPKRSRSILKTPNSGTTPSSPGFGANLSDPYFIRLHIFYISGWPPRINIKEEDLVYPLQIKMEKI